MANSENLKSWKKGESGNLKGRRLGSRNRSTVVKEWFKVMKTARNPINGLEETQTMEDWLTVMQFHKGITRSDTAAYKALMGSAYGEPKETLDVNADVPSIDFRKLYNFTDDSGTGKD